MPQIGLRVPKERGVAESIEFSEQAVDAGVDSLWVSEGLGRNQVILLSLLADRFDGVDIGSGIFNIYSRTPALMAMTAVGLDELADQFMLGLGISDENVIKNLHGIDFGNPLRREREYIEIINQLLSGQPANYHGTYFDLSKLAIRDVDESSTVPIYLAAMGDTNLILTGEFADGWMPLFLPIEEFESKLELIGEGLDRQDRDRSEMDVAPLVLTCISESEPERAKDEVRSILAFYIGAMGEYHYQNVRTHGFETEADQIRSLWQNGDRDEARAAVTDGMLTSLSVSGTPREAKRTLGAYDANDVDLLISYVPPRADDSLISESISHMCTL